MISIREYGTAARGRERYHITSEFDHLTEKKYRRHCGPTAITNLVMTLSEGSLLDPEEESRAAKEVFRKVAGIGKKRFYYMNAELGFFGGTFDFRAPGFLRQCSLAFRLPVRKIHHRRFLTEKAAKRALERGSFLYLELRYHKKYGNHHILCYGGREDSNGKLYLRIADGWSRLPCLLPAKELGLAYMVEVEPAEGWMN